MKTKKTSSGGNRANDLKGGERSPGSTMWRRSRPELKDSREPVEGGKSSNFLEGGQPGKGVADWDENSTDKK